MPSAEVGIIKNFDGGVETFLITTIDNGSPRESAIQLRRKMMKTLLKETIVC